VYGENSMPHRARAFPDHEYTGQLLSATKNKTCHEGLSAGSAPNPKELKHEWTRIHTNKKQEPGASVGRDQCISTKLTTGRKKMREI